MQLPLDLNLIQHLLNSRTVTCDLNDLTTSGFYYVQTPTNAPTADWPHVVVNASEDHTKVFQLCAPDGNDGLWYRNLTNKQWSEWIHLANGTDTSYLTSIPESEWVLKGIKMDDLYFFRNLTLIKLGTDVLVAADMQFTTQAQLNKGWNTIMSFPISYLKPYLGKGSNLSLTFESDTLDKINDMGIKRDTGELTVYAVTTIPAETTLNLRAIVLLAKDTKLINPTEE